MFIYRILCTYFEIEITIFLLADFFYAAENLKCSHFSLNEFEFFFLFKSIFLFQNFLVFIFGLCRNFKTKEVLRDTIVVYEE